MKYCQGTKCHTYRTKDRIRGSKGDKHYETRRNSRGFYNGEFCSNICRDDWYNTFGERAINHFGRIHEPKRLECNNAWYKDSKYNYNGGRDSYSTYYFVNDLLGERRPITQQQYQDDNLTTPPS